ncbi:MAG TPA: hypothetical protein VFK17_04165 [Gaiellaceae bacterium]|jgi:hypothetical protein|nr:hypothetical protein [Gaiellaceae bacterium]
MSFFEPPPPPPEPPPGPPPPEWAGPPDNVVPASFPLDLVVARTDDLALFVHSGRAYRRGFEFSLGLRARGTRARLDDPLMSWRAGRGGGFDDAVLRFGIAFADGRKATVFDSHPGWGRRDETPDMVLRQRGGGGGGSSWDFRFWAWPLPPDGPLAFVTEWPSEGIALTRVELDSSVVRAAATRVEELWPEGEPRGGGWVRYAR